jgi:hypothetical protein
MLVRTAFGAVATSALVAASLAPAYAGGYGGGGDNGELRVKVCKYIYGGDRGDEFDIKSWTDDESGRDDFGHRDCYRYRLDYDDNKFWLKEYDLDDYDDDYRVYFKVGGDVDKARSYRNGHLKVWFDDHEDDPYLRVYVYNRGDKYDHHY